MYKWYYCWYVKSIGMFWIVADAPSRSSFNALIPHRIELSISEMYSGSFVRGCAGIFSLWTHWIGRDDARKTMFGEDYD